MAKGGRKKKEKRKDFQKVKLKVGKRKPQAENFTVTTFKSQAIQIREQIKSSGNVDESEPTTQRKKNIQELLCHLNHYNVSIRQSSIAGMKELLSAHPALIAQHLPSLIDGVSVLITDKEDAVRKSGISLLQLVLQSTPSDRIAPFFPVLSAHLSCAMTHLQEDVQLDSLSILDLMLRYYPRLLTSHSQELLAIFVQQISRQRRTAISWAEGQTGALELAVKPGSQISSHKWRQKVLLRLKQFLTALLQEQYRKHSPRDTSNAASNKENYTVTVHDEGETFAPIFAASAQANGCKEGFVLSSLSSTSSTSSSDFTKPDNLLGFVRSLVPLLLQCWMEVAPKSHEQSQAQLHAVALETLNGVLSVIQLLWRWMQSTCEEKQDFRCMTQLQKLYQKKFINHLLSCFPYASHNAPVRAKHSGKVPSPVSVVSPNLAICEIMSYFMKKSNMENAWLRRIMAYVLEMCIEGADLSVDNMKSLLGVVRRLVKALPNQESVSDLLQAVFSLYDSCHHLSSNKNETMTCVDELISAHGTVHPSSMSVDSLFLQSLPDLVQGHGSQRALEILLRRAAQHQPEALKCIQRSLGAFVDPKDGVFLRLAERLQVSIIHLVHYVDPLDLATLRSLAMCCHDNRVSAKNVAHLINVLSTRFVDVGASPQVDLKLPFNMSDYVTFLFSVSIGCSRGDLSRVPDSRRQSAKLTGRDVTPPRSITGIAVVSNSETDRDLHHYTTILKSVCMTYGLISSKQQMWDIVKTMITDCLNCHQMMPYCTVYALLYTSNYLSSSQDADWSQETSNKLMECCLATLYAVVSDDVTGIPGSDWSVALWGQTVELLVTSRQVMVALMQRIHECVSDLTDADHIQRIAMVMIRLLQTQQLSLPLVQVSIWVKSAIHRILHHHLATADCRWAAELQYEASVILQTQSQ